MELNLTQLQLASLIDVAPETVSRWENGHEPIPGILDKALDGYAAEGRPVMAYELPGDPSRLRQTREAFGLSRAELGQLVGVTAAAVQNWEDGRRPMPGSLPYALASIGW